MHAASVEVARGDWDAEFPIDVFQTGSGTSSNMNTNEVLATLAGERLGAQGAPERRRQRPAVEQRPVPVRHPHRGDEGDDQRPEARTRPPRVRARGEGRRVRPGRQGRPHPPHGRHPGHPRPGVRRLRGAGALRSRASRRRAPARRGAAARRHGGRLRHQRTAGLRRRGHRAHRVRDRAAAHRGAQPLRGQRRTGRARRAVRPAAHDRRRPQQDRERPALDGLGAAHRAVRDLHPRSAAGQFDHARQGQSGAVRGGHAGRRAGRGQRRGRRVGRRRRVRSS